MHPELQCRRGAQWLPGTVSHSPVTKHKKGETHVYRSEQGGAHAGRTARGQQLLPVKTRGLAAVAIVLLILIVGIATLYAVRSQVPPTAVSPTSSVTPTATVAIATSTPVATALATTPAPAATRTPTPPTAGLFRWPCGTVTAYTAPTAIAAGSVSLGTSTFALARGSGPTNNVSLTVGSSLCVNGEQDAAGVFTQFSVSPMGEGICSVVTAYTPASATAPGSLDFGTPKPPVRIPVAAGVTFTPAQVTGDQCFRVTPDAQGTAQVTAYTGPRR